jgi:hypothetical protein
MQIILVDYFMSKFLMILQNKCMYKKDDTYARKRARARTRAHIYITKLFKASILFQLNL